MVQIQLINAVLENTLSGTESSLSQLFPLEDTPHNQMPYKIIKVNRIAFKKLIFSYFTFSSDNERKGYHSTKEKTDAASEIAYYIIGNTFGLKLCDR